MNKKEIIKTVIALFVAVFMVFVVTFLATFIETYDSAYGDIRITLFVASIASVIALFAVLVLGLPIHLMLKRIGHTNIYWYALAGFIPGLVFVISPLGEGQIYERMGQFIYIGLIGCISAICSWYVFYKRFN